MIRFSAWVCLAFSFASPVFAATVDEYAKGCYREMGVVIPQFNCLSEKATIIPVTVNGRPVSADHPVKKCDRPTHIGAGDHPCAVGSRLLKLESTNDKGEKITTMIICRRYRDRALDSPLFDDIGIIQYNAKSNAACWFARTEDGKTPYNATAVPSPYDPKDTRSATKANGFWDSPKHIEEKGKCIKCHSASVWLRTPYVSQAKRDRRRKNAVPDEVNHGPLKHVGFPLWNRNPPSRMYIDAKAYDALYPKTVAERRRMLAPPNTCTECHAIGTHPWAKEGGYCGSFIKASIGKVRYTSDAEDIEGHGSWMPPRNRYKGKADRAKFEAYYKRAFEAVERCCKNPNLTVNIDGKDVKVCQAPPPAEGIAKVYPGRGIPTH